MNVSLRCGSQGWCLGTLGNISALNKSERRVYIKALGADMNKLTLGDILTLDLEGSLLEGEGKPSIEANFHLGIYGVRREVTAVLHVHLPLPQPTQPLGRRYPWSPKRLKLFSATFLSSNTRRQAPLS